MTAPVPLDRLVGRQAELARLNELRRRARLVTVRGPGGAGKTRLAAEYAGGAIWVELASLNDPKLVEAATAAAVGVTEQPGRRLLDTIASALSGRRALLVLDNCEHLIDATATLAESLLARCADLTILATSREALDVPGEAVLQLGALSQSEAAELFEERARAAGYTVTEADSQTVTSICEQLEGHPLSIELAARRVRVLGPVGVLRRLGDRLTLLVDRHRDLATAIGWSHDLLDDTEQAVFRRVSVLAGGFGVQAASAAAGFDAFDVVANLESKSLLTGAKGRFRQLESIRLYANEKLGEAGEVGETRQRVVAWLTGLARKYADQAFPTMEVLAALDAERDTLLAALDWADEEKPLLTAALTACWRERGQFGPGRVLLDAVLDTQGEHRALVHAQAAVLATDMGDGRRAQVLARKAVELDRGVRSLSRLAGACLAAGDPQQAVDNAREALELAREHGTPFEKAVCLHNLAYISLHAGRKDEAATLLNECLPVCRQRPEPWLRVGALHSAGTVALAQNDIKAARRYFEEALRFATNHVARKIHSVEGLAVVAARRGEHVRARRLAGATRALRQQWGMRQEDPWDQFVRAAVGTVDAEVMDADELVAYALAEEGPLTHRECEVVELVASGLSSRQIGARLRIAERTVEAHLDNARGKLDLRSRSELAAWWARRQRSR